MHERHINPDHYLQTSTGRVFTKERQLAAWDRVYEDLEAALRRRSSTPMQLYLVMGVQGSGKTTWIRRNIAALPGAVFLDAALPAARHRARALDIARRCGVEATTVWINTPLEIALARNASRPADERVPEEAMRSVFSLLEAPTVSEGFVRVVEILDNGVSKGL
ncbi:Predicted kinase [Variovorax sp. PDC80]|uniref:AAA family ATPase n=1 Tax=Variovorax sp. PDC80 TaxID=1882827 RepID=UPI0008EBC1F7|nr:AAA family ATPase [Variovorax sp. PDC80]SFO27587.1 Predicted kinase [Variovorax sp. PDC80]